MALPGAVPEPQASPDAQQADIVAQEVEGCLEQAPTEWQQWGRLVSLKSDSEPQREQKRRLLLHLLRVSDQPGRGQPAWLVCAAAASRRQPPPEPAAAQWFMLGGQGCQCRVAACCTSMQC